MFLSLKSYYFYNIIDNLCRVILLVIIVLLVYTINDFRLIVYLSTNIIKTNIKDNKFLVTNKVSYIKEVT